MSIVLASPSCKSAHDHAMECIAGDANACERACEKGVGGVDGCLKAADFHAQDTPEHRTKALALLERGCALDVADACIRASRLVPSGGPGTASVLHREELFRKGVALHVRSCEGERLGSCEKVIALLEEPDAVAQEGALDSAHARACVLGRKGSCEQTLRRRLAKDLEGSLIAARRFCALQHEADPSRRRDCSSALEAKARALTEAATRCENDDARGCEQVGDGLGRLAPERAKKSYEKACMLRGLDVGVLWTGFRADLDDTDGGGAGVVAESDGPLACCIASFFKTDWLRGPMSPKSVDPSTWVRRSGGFGSAGRLDRPSEPSLELRPAVVEAGPLTADATFRAAEPLLHDWTECYRAGLKNNPHLQGLVVLRFLVDKNGRAHALGIKDSTLPDSGVISCMATKLNDGLRLGISEPSRASISLEAVPKGLGEKR
jgi:hypothetical protein